MVAFASQVLKGHNLNRSVPLYGAIVGGVVMAASVVLMPADTLETLVWNTGVAALVPMAAPPLGITARLLIALGGGVLVAALLWSSLFLLFGPGGVFAGSRAKDQALREDGVPVIRRADAHPDAPPRRPMSAADLGTPLMEVGTTVDIGRARDHAEREIPVDLNLPLAAFDPTAMLPVPMEPVRPVAPLATGKDVVIDEQPVPAAAVDPIPAQVEPEPVIAPTGPVAPTPMMRPTRAPVDEPDGPPSIEALLQRLEQGAGRRGRKPPR